MQVAPGYTKSKWPLIMVILIMTMNNCDVIDPDDRAVSYLRVDSFMLEPSSFYGEGLPTHAINDVWVNIDGNLLGTYQLPFSVPVLSTGHHTIMLRPGIENNGISESRVIYPFMQKVEIDTFLTEGQELTLIPRTGYDPLAQTAWEENFENVGSSLEPTKLGNMPISLKDDGANTYMHIEMTEEGQIFEIQMNDSVYLPVDRTPVYLEMTYQTNQYLVVSLLAYSYSQSSRQKMMQLNPTQGWNKIYIEIGQFLNQSFNPVYFRVSIGTAYHEDMTGTNELSLDDLRILHF